MEKLMLQLDMDQPRWAMDWAQESDLRQLIEDAVRYDAHDAQRRLRDRVAQRLFHRILNAAVAAGLVKA